MNCGRQCPAFDTWLPPFIQMLACTLKLQNGTQIQLQRLFCRVKRDHREHQQWNSSVGLPHVMLLLDSGSLRIKQSTHLEGKCSESASRSVTLVHPLCLCYLTLPSCCSMAASCCPNGGLKLALAAKPQNCRNSFRSMSSFILPALIPHRSINLHSHHAFCHPSRCTSMKQESSQDTDVARP